MPGSLPFFLYSNAPKKKKKSWRRWHRVLLPTSMSISSRRRISPGMFRPFSTGDRALPISSWRNNAVHHFWSGCRLQTCSTSVFGCYCPRQPPRFCPTYRLSMSVPRYAGRSKQEGKEEHTSIIIMFSFALST